MEIKLKLNITAIFNDLIIIMADQSKKRKRDEYGNCSIPELYSEKKSLEEKLAKVASEIKQKEKKDKEESVSFLDEVQKKYDSYIQECTCDVGLPKEHEFHGSVECLKHLSRHYKNKGCYWCGYTDCSKFGC